MPRALRTTGDGYALDLEAVSVDALRFEQLLVQGRKAMASGNPALARSLLRRALDLWRGAAYADFAYESWGRLEAERLEELRVVASEEWLAAELALGRHAELLPEVRRLAREHPTRERLQAQAMLALYRCGRQSEALEVYSTTRLRLRDELGLEPGPDLRELERRILQHDPQLAPTEAVERAPHPLPSPLDDLVGRQQELRELEEILVQRRARILVLTGAGGSGKTRLALEAARESAASFANGAVFVDLSPLRDPMLVVGAVAERLGIAIAPDAEPFERLTEALRTREQLLVLDNVEQLRSATPKFVELLVHAPHVVLLFTSRVALRLTGEHVFPVEPLTPADAAVLFRRRAEAADARFHPTPEDARAIDRICRRLDGLPLAIELAATRVRALSPVDLLELLEPLLQRGPQDRPARQQTLRATIGWSVELLSPEERRDLSSLSIFAGGCTLEGAEAVARTSVERLSSLVEQSLVRHDRSCGSSRYTMLETIREFAREQLPPAELEPLAHRHANHILELGEAADACRGAAREAALQRLRPEVDNLRAAIAWALESDAALALRLVWVASLFPLPTNELRVWLERALALSEEDTTLSRARALHAAAYSAGTAQEFERSRELWQRALSLYRQLQNEAGAARALAGLASAASRAGETDTARSLYAQSLELYRAHGDQDGEWIVTNDLGELERSAGNYGRARELLESAVSVATASADLEAVAMSRHGLGDLALAQGQMARASEHYRTAISISAPLAGGRRNLCWSLAGLACTAGGRGDVERAGILWGGAETLEEELDLPLPAHVRRRYRRPLEELDRDALEAAIRHGRALPLGDVIALALEQPHAPSTNA